jgi:hypothetical protein
LRHSFTVASPAAGSNEIVIIDLDLAPPPRRPVRRPRRLPLLLALVVVLLTLGSSARPTEVAVPRVVAVEAERVVAWLLGGETLYTAKVAEDSAAVEVIARALDGNEIVWSRWMEGDGQIPIIEEVGPYLVVTSVAGFAAAVLDRRTGQVRWESSGNGMAVRAGDRIVLWEGDRLGVLDLTTLRVPWWIPFDRALTGAASAGRYVLVADDNGDVLSYVAGTGERAGSASGLSAPAMTAPGEHVYLLEESAVTALSLPKLDVLWNTPVTLPFTLAPCGTRLCVAGAAGLTALDPRSGAISWSSAEWTAWSGGLASAEGGRNTTLDPETGRVLDEVGRGIPVGDLLLRADRDRTWVLEWATGGIRAILPGSGAPAPCAHVDDHLACQAGRGVTVWRLPTAPPRA